MVEFEFEELVTEACGSLEFAGSSILHNDPEIASIYAPFQPAECFEQRHKTSERSGPDLYSM